MSCSAQELVEELPLVRLEPAESARPPRGGTLRTPVYMTQARAHASRKGSLGTTAHVHHVAQEALFCDDSTPTAHAHEQLL